MFLKREFSVNRIPFCTLNTSPSLDLLGKLSNKDVFTKESFTTFTEKKLLPTL